MNEMNAIISPEMNIIKEFESVFDRGLSNPYINTSLKVFLTLYAALVAPKLPPVIAKLMDNILVKISFAFLIVFMATKDTGIALLIAIIFIMTLQYSAKAKLYDTSLSIASENSTSWLPSAKTDVDKIPTTKNTNQNLVSSPVLNNGAHTKYSSSDLSPSEIATMNNAMPSNNIEQFVEQIEGGNVPSTVTNSQVFTSDNQFKDVQSNQVYSCETCDDKNNLNCTPCSPDSCVPTTFKNQFCVQGLQDNTPDGYENQVVNNF